MCFYIPISFENAKFAFSSGTYRDGVSKGENRDFPLWSLSGLLQMNPVKSRVFPDLGTYTALLTHFFVQPGLKSGRFYMASR